MKLKLKSVIAFFATTLLLGSASAEFYLGASIGGVTMGPLVESEMFIGKRLETKIQSEVVPTYDAFLGYMFDVGSSTSIGAELYFTCNSKCKMLQHPVNEHGIAYSTIYDRKFAFGIAPRLGYKINQSWGGYLRFGLENGSDVVGISSSVNPYVETKSRGVFTMVPGVGIEYRFCCENHPLLVRLEYQYHIGQRKDFGLANRRSNGSEAPVGYGTLAKLTDHAVKLGIAFTF